MRPILNISLLRFGITIPNRAPVSHQGTNDTSPRSILLIAAETTAKRQHSIVIRREKDRNTARSNARHLAGNLSKVNPPVKLKLCLVLDRQSTVVEGVPLRYPSVLLRAELDTSKRGILRGLNANKAAGSPKIPGVDLKLVLERDVS